MGMANDAEKSATMRKLLIFVLLGAVLTGCSSVGADVHGNNKGARAGVHGTIFKF